MIPGNGAAYQRVHVQGLYPAERVCLRGENVAAEVDVIRGSSHNAFTEVHRT